MRGEGQPLGLTRRQAAVGRILAGSALLALLPPAPAIAGQAQPSGEQPASRPAPAAKRPGQAQPSQPGVPSEAQPSEGVEPVGPVQPVRTFEPVPLPGELPQAQPATQGTAAPALPSPPPAAAAVTGATPGPVVPGAAEAGFVVADTRSLYGRDFVPAVGAAVIAAAGFRASTGLQVSYDSNVFFLAPGQEVPPGLGSSRSDWILRPDLTLGIGREVGQQLFFLDTTLSRDFFLRNSGRGQNAIQLAGGVDWRLLSSCAGRVQGSWSTRETSPQDFFAVIAGSTQNTDFFFNATCNRGTGLVPSFSFAAGRQSFEPDFRDVADVDYWSVGGSLGYQFNPALQAGVQVNRQNSRFPNQPLFPATDPDGPVNGVSALSLLGFASYLAGASLSANVSIGWTRTDSESPLIEDFSGLTGNLTFAYASPTFGASFFVLRNVNLGNVGGATLRVRSSIGLTGSYRFSPELSVNTGFSRDLDDNRGDIVANPFINLADQKFWRAFLSANYSLGPRLNLTAGYRYQSRAFETVFLDDVPIVLLPPASSHSVNFGLRFILR